MNNNLIEVKDGQKIKKGTILQVRGFNYECAEDSIDENVIYVKGGGHLTRKGTYIAFETEAIT